MTKDYHIKCFETISATLKIDINCFQIVKHQPIFDLDVLYGVKILRYFQYSKVFLVVEKISIQLLVEQKLVPNLLQHRLTLRRLLQRVVEDKKNWNLES